MKSGDGKAFGALLGQFRIEAKLTQKLLADLMGKTRGTILNWENGTYLPKERALVLELAKHLRLDGLKRDQLLEAALFDPLGTVWTIPFQRNPFFTGREDVLSRLRQALDLGTTVTLMQPQALKGLGGIGKTHTAIEYAYRYRDEYQAILWAPATTSSILQASLVSIVAALNLPQKTEREQEVIVKAVKEWLMNHSNWLLILDNVEDLESVGLLYPWAHSGHVIITTRSQSVGGIAFSISLEKMEPKEGAIFLLRRAALIGPYEEKEQARGKDYEKATHLSEVLGGLPLALDQAAAYIEKTQCGLTTYLTLYKTQRKKLLKERGSLTTDHPESVTVTFSLAFQKVKSASAVAGELLRFCAFLSPDAIPEEIITHAGTSLGPILEAASTDLVTFNAAIGTLLAYSLVRRNTDIETGTQILSVHRLVQAVLRDDLLEAERRTWAERAILAINIVFPDVEPGTWSRCEHLLSQALQAAQFVEGFQIIRSEAGRLLYQSASYLKDRARYQEAELLFQQALRVQNQALGPEHLDVALSLNGLAILYGDLGRYAEAEPLYQQVLRIRLHLLGPEHDRVATIFNNLATLYHKQGKYTEAEPLYQQALSIWKQQLGPGHPHIATALYNLGNLYREQGKYEKAEPFYQRALDIREKQLGPKHLDMASALNGLAILCDSLGKYEKAELLYRRALDIWEQHLGPEHPQAVYPLNGLAILYYNQGKYAEAEPLFQRVLDLWEQQLGPEHPLVATLLNNLATLYCEQGRYTEAVPLAQRAFSIWEQRLEPEHPNIANVLYCLANLYREQDKYVEAEPLFQRALQIREQQLGPEHPSTAEVLHDFAIFREDQGKFREALSLYQRALTIRQHAFGSEHHETRATQQRLTDLRRSISQEAVISPQDDTSLVSLDIDNGRKIGGLT